MLENIIRSIKGVWQRMFPIKNIQQALNTKAAISQEMFDMISTWYDIYTGNAYWLEENKNLTGLNLSQSITREFTNVVLNEMTVNVNNETLDEKLKKVLEDIYIYLPEGLATGSMIIKPLGADSVQFVSANAFIPVEYDSEGNLLKVIFPEFHKIDEKYYTRLEYHSLDGSGLTITNKAYVSSNSATLGQEIDLTSVDMWADIEPYVFYPGMDKQAFGYYKNPINNTIDNSKCSISIYHNAINLLRLADMQFSRLDWEFESGERAIYADETVVKGNKVSSLKDRLFRFGDFDGGSNGDFFHEFSPTLRQADIVAGLEEYKRNIEFAVGLAYGDISNPSTVAKTATEIKSAKDRKYNTVTAIQNNLKKCIEQLCYAIAFYNSLTTSNYEISINFKDSILTSETEERLQDMQDLNMGIMRAEEYRAKWYGEDIDTAINNLPPSAEVMP